MQQRAIETRKKLLEVALQLYVEKGYHYTTVDEVAASAGLSTGVAYRYFKNKKDLLLAAIENEFDSIQNITNTEDADLTKFTNMEELISYALDRFEMIHKKYYGIHEELESLRHSDADVKALYDRIEMKAVGELLQKAERMFEGQDHLPERIYMAIGMMENYCHMTMDEKYADLDFAYMKKETIYAVINILEINTGSK